MSTRLLHSFVFASLMAGCTAQGQVQYAGEADVQLVEVSPGVQVIADYDEPVFYSENYYWRYDNGVWYRSPYHTRGWVRVETVPVAVRQIDQPRRYVHYHGQGAVEVRDHRTEPMPPPGAPGPVVRDHRTEPMPPPPGSPPPPPVRDHREEAEERHEQHEAAKEERHEQHEAAKEQKEQAKEERKEQKEERKEERKEQKEERKDQKKDHRH